MAQPAIQERPPTDEETKRPWYNPRTFEAFDFGPFRWYMGAMIWWNAAMSMQMIVRGFLAYHLTDEFIDEMDLLIMPTFLGNRVAAYLVKGG